jgi:hypothetical protein
MVVNDVMIYAGNLVGNSKNKNNAINFNPLFFKCLLNSQTAIYKVSTVKETNKTDTYTQTNDQRRQLTTFKQ